MSWPHRLLVLWMAAAAVHLPMPVADGDDLKSGEVSLAGAARAMCWDIDFVLLGCDPPDDCDDGPVDDDPENGSGSPLGSYLAQAQNKSPNTPDEGDASVMPVDARAAGCLIRGASRLSAPQRALSRPARNLSFGQACQCGLAVMRC